MERLEYNSYGRPEVVHLGSFTLPEPQADELIVRVAADSINTMDWKIRSRDRKMFIGSLARTCRCRQCRGGRVLQRLCVQAHRPLAELSSAGHRPA